MTPEIQNKIRNLKENEAGMRHVKAIPNKIPLICLFKERQ